MHECFFAVPDLVKKRGFTSEQALVLAIKAVFFSGYFDRLILGLEQTYPNDNE